MWATSLKVASSVANAFIETPSGTDIYATCEDAYELIGIEREEYVQCVEVQLGQCNINLAQAADAEADRIEKAHENNVAIVKAAREIQSSCSAAFSGARFGLEGWAQNGVALPYLSSCSAEDKEKINDQIGDISAVRSEAFTLSTEYSEESQSTVSRLADYIVLRTAYDAEYADNKTQHMQDDFQEWVDFIYLPSFDLNVTFDALFPDVDQLVSCVTTRDPKNGSDCPLLDSAYELIDETMTELNTMVNAATDQLAEFEQTAERYKDNVDNAYKNSKAFFEGVHDTVARLSLNTDDWGGWFDMELNTFFPDDVEWPVAITFEEIPDVSEVWDKVAPALDAFYVNLTKAQRDAYLLGKKWKKDVSDQLDKLPDIMPEDYNPPQYVGADDTVMNVTAEKKRHKDRSNGFIDQAAVALDAFAELSQYTEENFNPPTVTFNFTDFRDKMSEFNFSFETLQASAIDFKLWFVQFGSLSSMLFYADFLFRAYQTIRLLYYYWGRGGLNIPDVDVTADQEPSNPFKLSTPRLFALIISNPMTPAFIAMVFTIWGSALLSSIYSPLYNEYLTGCVQKVEGIENNGTFLTENLFAISYNYASQDGNTATFAGLDAYDVQRAEICSQYGSNSANRQNEDLGVLASLKESHSQSANGLALYTGCIDASYLDGQFQDACCGLDGYEVCSGGSDEQINSCPLNSLVSPTVPYSLPSTYLLEPTCQSAMVGDEWTLQDSVYNCDNLPTCDMSCEGPNKVKTKRDTEACGCMLEWGGHSIWLQLVIAVVIYVLLNMSRIKLMQGLTKLFWKYLHPGLFTFRSTCTREGEVVVGEGDGKELKDVEMGGEGKGAFAALLRRKLEEVLKKFWRKGIPQVMMAIALNVPWIYLLLNVSHDIKYRDA